MPIVVVTIKNSWQLALFFYVTFLMKYRPRTKEGKYIKKNMEGGNLLSTPLCFVAWLIT
jgi:hypothetical protein